MPHRFLPGASRAAYVLLLVLGCLGGLGRAAPFAYVTNTAGNSVSVVDVNTNSAVAFVPVGLFPWGVAVNPGGARAYITNSGNNTLSIIDTATNRVVATPIVGASPVGIALNRDGTTGYVTNYYGGDVSVLDALSQ